MSKKRGQKFKRYSDRRDLILKRRRQFMPVLEKLGLVRAFMELPQWLRHKVLSLKARAYRVEADPSLSESTQASEILTEFEEAFRRPIFDPLGNGKRLSYNEYHCYFAPLLGSVDSAAKTGRITPTEVGDLAPLLKKGIRTWRRIANKRMNTQLARVVLRRSRLDERLFGFRIVRDNSRWKTAKILRAQAERPRRCTFHLDGESRPAFQCGGWFGKDGFKWVEWQNNIVGSAGDRKLPVYVQSHVLHRLFERLVSPDDRWMAHYDMVMSLRLPKIIQWQNEAFWAELREPSQHRLGYLIGCVVDDKVLIRTFLFLTMQGTPEAKMLHERLGTRRVDIERLRLDELATFLDTDIGEDPELIRIFTDCGCGHLFDLRKLWKRTAYKKWKHAENVREYLHLPTSQSSRPTMSG